ncbi:MAG: NADH-quinone oxidoreductase subunit I [Syntrophales bacterium]|jgi:NADH-quinone oxidoreductase subunit I|nr:NADH-quinone oxidoreductase subunit I [Syntrophales bacterium]
MTVTPASFIKGAASLAAGMGVTIKSFFQPVVTSQYPREVLEITPRFRGHIKLLASPENPLENMCIACGICVRNCPSGSIKKVDGEKREGEKRKRATVYMLDFTTCSQCGICVESCPSKALGFSGDFNIAGFKRADFYFDLVKEFDKRKKAS